jgi:hypothetical protein
MRGLGTVIANKATDLRMGADYAWSRGAASRCCSLQLLAGNSFNVSDAQIAIRVRPS